MGLLPWLGIILYAVRVIVLAAVTVAVVVFLASWLVRTRRVNPFHPLAKFTRRVADPLLAPIERRIVRAGGLPSAAPLWALAGSVVIGILVISGFNFLAQSIVEAVYAASAGPRGVLLLLVQATFSILRLAIIIVVIVSWLPISPYSPWVRWAFAISEPILRPLRQVVPRLGMIDITPFVAYILLGILEWAILRL